MLQVCISQSRVQTASADVLSDDECLDLGFRRSELQCFRCQELARFELRDLQDPCLKCCQEKQEADTAKVGSCDMQASHARRATSMPWLQLQSPLDSLPEKLICLISCSLASLPTLFLSLSLLHSPPSFPFSPDSLSSGLDWTGLSAEVRVCRHGSVCLQLGSLPSGPGYVLTDLPRRRVPRADNLSLQLS